MFHEVIHSNYYMISESAKLADKVGFFFSYRVALLCSRQQHWNNWRQLSTKYHGNRYSNHIGMSFSDPSLSVYMRDLFPPVHLSVCLCVNLFSVCPYFQPYLSICLSVYMWNIFPVCPYFHPCLSLCLPVYLWNILFSVCPYFHPCIVQLSVCLPVCLSVCLSTLFFYLSVCHTSVCIQSVLLSVSVRLSIYLLSVSVILTDSIYQF